MIQSATTEAKWTLRITNARERVAGPAQTSTRTDVAERGTTTPLPFEAGVEPVQVHTNKSKQGLQYA